MELISYGRTLALAMVTMLVLAAPIGAQTTNGTIEGTVIDAQGAVLPGVTLTLRNVASGVTRTAISEGDGKYRLAGLPPGRYDLRAELQGFAAVEVKDLVMTIGLEMKNDITMRIESLQETVTVTGQSPVVETTRSEVAGLVTQDQIEQLPVSSRLAVGLALLMPGTGTDTVRTHHAAVNVGGSYSFYTNMWLVDGVSNTEPIQNEPRQNFPQAALREFKVNVAQSKAEAGSAVGGIVSMVTKSGANQLHGEAFEYFRDKSLNAMNKFEQERHDRFGDAKPGYRRNQYGFAIGGPIQKDRMHFFGTFERTSADEPFVVSTGRPEFYSAVEGTFPGPSWRNLGLVRADWQLTPQQSLMARFSAEDEFLYCTSCGGRTAATGGGGNNWGLAQPRSSTVVGHTWVISSSMLNELRFQYAPITYVFMPPGKPFWFKPGTFPQDVLNNVPVVYQFPSLTYNSNQAYLVALTWWEWAESLSVTRGNHSWKFGVDINHVPAENTLPWRPGTWQFQNDQYFNPSDPAAMANLRGPIVQFSGSLGNTTNKMPTQRYVGYVQDDWQVRSNLTLNLGLRYDLQRGAINEGRDLQLPVDLPWIDTSVRGDWNNVGPRLGLAWDVHGNGRLAVRAASGVYYNMIRLNQTISEADNGKRLSFTIRNPSYPDPYGGLPPIVYAQQNPQNFTILGNDMVNPYAVVHTIGASQQLGSNLALHTDVVYNTTRGDNKQIELNPRDPLRAGGPRPYPQYGNVLQRVSTSKSLYKALMMRLDKRFSRRYQYMISYTLTDSMDNNPAGTVLDPTDPSRDWGPSDGFRRHNLILSGSALLPGDITFGAVWSLRSPQPWTALAGTDVNQDLITGDYVPGTSRNSSETQEDFLDRVNTWRAQNGRAPISLESVQDNRYNAIDVRVSKAFSFGGSREFELIAQVFNILGTDNLGQVFTFARQNNALSDAFGQITNANPRQQAELAVRFTF